MQPGSCELIALDQNIKEPHPAIIQLSKKRDAKEAQIEISNKENTKRIKRDSVTRKTINYK